MTSKKPRAAPARRKATTTQIEKLREQSTVLAGRTKKLAKLIRSQRRELEPELVVRVACLTGTLRTAAVELEKAMAAKWPRKP